MVQPLCRKRGKMINVLLLEITDKLVDGITNSIDNPGIKLTYEPKYDYEISPKISKNLQESDRSFDQALSYVLALYCIRRLTCEELHCG